MRFNLIYLTLFGYTAQTLCQGNHFLPKAIKFMFAPAIHGHHRATRLKALIHIDVCPAFFFNGQVVNGVQRDDAIKSFLAERQISDISNDIEALVAQLFAGFLHGDVG